MKSEITWVNLAVLGALLGAVLVVQLLGFSRYLGEYAVAVVILSYGIGKTVRDYELKIWEKRQAKEREFFQKIEQNKGK